MLQCLRQFWEFQSKERGGFSDIFQAALKERIEIKLAVASGTSWLTDGPAGYIDSMQLIFDWSHANYFKLGLNGKMPNLTSPVYSSHSHSCLTLGWLRRKVWKS